MFQVNPDTTDFLFALKTEFTKALFLLLCLQNNTKLCNFAHDCVTDVARKPFNNMTTFKICIFRHQKRKDGKYPVSIRICHKRKYAYIKTGVNVSSPQINKRTFEVKDPIIVADLSNRIEKMESIISSKLGFRADTFDAKNLSLFLTEKMSVGDQIDFVTYGRQLAARRRQNGQDTTARMYERTIRVVVDFANGRNKILFSEINTQFLNQFVAYLRSSRRIERNTGDGHKVILNHKPLKDSSIASYLTDIRSIFNEARKEFNSDDENIIVNYPFRSVKVIRSAPKRRSIPAEDVKKVMTFLNDGYLKDGRKKGIRMTWIRASAVFMISFFFCGINTADIFDLQSPVEGRIEYKRRKTKDRRHDEAFISIAIPDEAEPIMEAFRDPSGVYAFNFRNHFADFRTFNKYINIALKKVAAIIGTDPELSTYYARHSWATIARNKAGVSKDDIDLALDHTPIESRMADVYIDKDFSMIDTANRKVIDYINSLPEPVINHDGETPKSETK